MNRRSFLASILAAGAAPVFLRSSSAAGLFLPRQCGFILGAQAIYRHYRSIRNGEDYEYAGTQIGEAYFPADTFGYIEFPQNPPSTVVSDGVPLL